MSLQKSYDILIIGSGAAGLSLAIRLADYGQIAVISKFALTAGSTYYAQGGISAVLDAQYSIESHIEDTLIAGAGLCDPDIVRLTVAQGKKVLTGFPKKGLLLPKEKIKIDNPNCISIMKAAIPIVGLCIPMMLPVRRYHYHYQKMPNNI
jgi:L-aspartate oxidase